MMPLLSEKKQAPYDVLTVREGSWFNATSWQRVKKSSLLQHLITSMVLVLPNDWKQQASTDNPTCYSHGHCLIVCMELSYRNVSVDWIYAYRAITFSVHFCVSKSTFRTKLNWPYHITGAANIARVNKNGAIGVWSQESHEHSSTSYTREIWYCTYECSIMLAYVSIHSSYRIYQ